MGENSTDKMADSVPEHWASFYASMDLAEKIFYTGLVSVGLTCNLIVFLIMMVRGRMHSHAYQFFIIAIAVSDFCSLLFIGLLDTLFSLYGVGGGRVWYTFHCSYISLFEFTAAISSVWFVVLFSIERYYSTNQPEISRVLFTKKRSLQYIGAVVGCSFVCALPHLLVFDFQQTEEGAVCSRHKKWAKVVYILHTMLLHVAPLIIIIYCNLRIVKQMMDARNRQKQRERVPRTRSPNGAIHRATCFLVLLSVCYFVLFTPKLVLDIILNSARESFVNERLLTSKTYIAMTRIAEAMYLSNSLVNFFVYATVSPSFRRHLARLFFIQLQAWRDSLESIDTRITNVTGANVEMTRVSQGELAELSDLHHPKVREARSVSQYEIDT